MSVPKAKTATTSPAVISARPAGPESMPRPERVEDPQGEVQARRSSPSTMSRTAIVSKMTTIAAASLRARKTRNERRTASSGSTSPRTTPVST